MDARWIGLLVAGAANVIVGVVICLVAEWLETRKGWPPADSWLRFGKMWRSLGCGVAFLGLLMVLAFGLGFIAHALGFV